VELAPSGRKGEDWIVKETDGWTGMKAQKKVKEGHSQFFGGKTRLCGRRLENTKINLNSV
jgi:hypothetical protein